MRREILMTLACLCIGGEAQAQSRADFSGRGLLEGCEALSHEINNFSLDPLRLEMGMCLGIIDTTANVSPYWIVCRPAGGSVGRNVDIVLSYMHEHPEVLDNELFRIATEAFNAEWRCKS